MYRLRPAASRQQHISLQPTFCNNRGKTHISLWSILAERDHAVRLLTALAPSLTVSTRVLAYLNIKDRAAMAAGWVSYIKIGGSTFFIIYGACWTFEGTMETGCEYGVAPDSHLEVQYVQLVFIPCGPLEVRSATLVLRISCTISHYSNRWLAEHAA